MHSTKDRTILSSMVGFGIAIASFFLSFIIGSWFYIYVEGSNTLLGQAIHRALSTGLDKKAFLVMTRGIVIEVESEHLTLRVTTPESPAGALMRISTRGARVFASHISSGAEYYSLDDMLITGETELPYGRLESGMRVSIVFGSSNPLVADYIVVRDSAEPPFR